MSTFDGWETRLYGDAMALPNGDELMHFRTKGSKNGVRRYQTESGEWTPLGLKERKVREGWGDSKRASRAEKKAAKLSRKIEKRENRKARVAAAKQAVIQKRASKNLKGVSDEELQRRINRIKKEIEYKELTRSPILKAGEKMVTSYLQGKEKKLERKMKMADLIVRQQEAKQKTIAAKAALTQARGGIIDNLMRGSKYKQAKTQLINAKADKTVRGALRKAVSKVIDKEGDRIVNEMGDKSLVMRGGRKIKSTVEKGREKTVDALKKYYAQDEKAAAEKKRKKQNKRDRKIGQQLRG